MTDQAREDAEIMWRPIETAPRDGTKFLGLHECDALAMFWHDGFKQFVSRYSRVTLAHGHTFIDTGLNYQDHHPEIHKPEWWMPIPVPPDGEESRLRVLMDEMRLR